MTRKRLPENRSGRTRKIIVANFDIYVTVNFFESGEPGEVFATIGKQGSTVMGFVNAWAIAVSKMLQYHVPWDVIKETFLHHKFEPNDSENPSLLHGITMAADSLIKENK